MYEDIIHQRKFVRYVQEDEPSNKYKKIELVAQLAALDKQPARFNLTTHVYEQQGRLFQDVGSNWESFGYIKDIVAPILPLLGADTTGAPMHDMSNAWYFCEQRQVQSLARQLRISNEQAQQMIDNPLMDQTVMAAAVDSMRPRWQLEANQVIDWLRGVDADDVAEKPADCKGLMLYELLQEYAVSFAAVQVPNNPWLIDDWKTPKTYRGEYAWMNGPFHWQCTLTRPAGVYTTYFSCGGHYVGVRKTRRIKDDNGIVRKIEIWTALDDLPSDDRKELFHCLNGRGIKRGSTLRRFVDTDIYMSRKLDVGAIPPTLTTVVESLLLDIRHLPRSFESWACDQGFDPDSRKAEKMFERIAQTRDEFARFVGGERKLEEFLGEHDTA